MRSVRRLLAVSALVALFGQTGCLFRTRVVESRTSTAVLQTATLRELVDRVNHDASQIHTLNATVDIATSVGGEKKGKVTDYQEIKGYILLRKPDMLRMIGLYPVVHNKAFDMVSEGNRFELWVPGLNKFYVGSAEVVHVTKNPLQNLRPQIVYNALLLPEIDGQQEIAVLENSTEMVVDPKVKKVVQQADYVLDVIRHTGNDWYLSRKIIFERVHLVPHRQIIYAPTGEVVTEATYQVYRDYNGIEFPAVIEIERPREEYSIRLVVEKLVFNEPLRDEQFALAQPPGSLLVNLDQPNQSAVASPGAGTPNSQR